MRASVFAVWAAIILWPCDHWGLTLYTDEEREEHTGAIGVAY